MNFNKKDSDDTDVVNLFLVYGNPRSIVGYFSSNRKKIFLLLCAFIMGTWIGSSIPSYRSSSPHMCSTSAAQEETTRPGNATTTGGGGDNLSLMSSNLINSSNTSIRNNKSSSVHDVDDDYIVYTNSCRIPRFDPYDATIKDAILTLEPLHCDKKPPLTFMENDVLLVNESILEKYGVQSLDELSCCYSSVKRLENGRTDDGYVISENCTAFQGAANITDEYIKVQCKFQLKNIKMEYVDFHFTVPLKDDVEKKASQVQNEREKSQHPRPFSIMILGLDSLSRMNFVRQLRRTRRFLMEQMQAIEMLGYNKVGDNTFPNLVTLLSGYSEYELEDICWKERKGSLDSCPWIWKTFSETGYRTLYGEDTEAIASFNYVKQGFYIQPTHYYLRPFIYAAEQFLAWERFGNAWLCLGSRAVHEVTFSWARRFMEVFSDKPYFGLIWGNSLTHDDVNYPQKADVFLEDMLRSLFNNGQLNDTILMFVSDHGMRWGTVRNTRIGHYEENLPPLYIALPPRFHREFPKATENLKINSRRFTSTYDLYKMLLAVLSSAASTSYTLNSSVADAYHSLSLANNSVANKQKGVSLFDLVPTNRTCEEAGVNIHYCACNETVPMSTNTQMAFAMAHVVVRELNENILASHKNQCAHLEVNEVRSVLRKSNVELHMQEDNKHDYHYTVSLSVLPSGAIFEGTVLNAGGANNYTLEGDISRLNLYGNQSACVSELKLKKFCYCQYNFHNISSTPSHGSST